MEKRPQLIFWIITTLALTLLFSTSLNGLITSFYFVTFLLPVALSTSLFFNKYLVPNYLLKGRRIRFIIYFIYMLIISIYLEMLVITGAFVILADYQFENLGKIAGDIYLLAIILYLVVFSNGFISVFRSLKQKEQRLSQLEEKERKNKMEFLTLKVDRRSVQVRLSDIIYIESLSDYVQVHTISATHITKEKISTMEQSLPPYFIRIHRSFIVNRNHIKSYNRESVELEGSWLTIGRKYKQEVKTLLDG